MGKVTPETMTPAHVKAARALLGWSAQELSELIDIGVATLRTFESGKDIKAHSRTAIFDGLYAHGVRMQNGGEPGVKITEPSKWAINIKQTYCPECGTALPKVRTPKNMRQFLWGGWTCEACGTEVGKLGQRLFSRNSDPSADSSE